MVLVEHARHTVETETIEVVLIHPEPQVAEQESHDFVMTVIEQPAVPQLVAATSSLVEVLVVCAVEFVESIQNVLGGMAVNNVEKHSDSHAVSHVDQFLEVFRWSVTTASGEEVVDLVPKAGIVGMLHNCHELDNVVSEISDSGQHVLGELLVSCNAQLG